MSNVVKSSTHHTPFLSQRVQSLKESATLAMSRKTRELQEQGLEIINLSLGEPDFPTPAHICEAAIEAIRSKKYFSYPPVRGYKDVCQVIAEKFAKENGIAGNIENIVVSTGAKQSIANVLFSIIDPGDEVLLPAPYWVSYPQLIQLAGGVAVPVETSLSDHYKLRPDKLQEKINAKTKALIFSSPNNPTGAVLNPRDLEQLAEVLLQYPNVLIISDEIYEYMNFAPPHVSIGAMRDLTERTVTVNGLSKGFAMTGWRVGYIHAPKPIAKACERIQGQVTSATNSIAQRCILAALQHSKENSHTMRDTYKKRSELAHSLLQDIPDVKSYLPQGAYYSFPDLSAYLGRKFGEQIIENGDDLTTYLLEHAKVSTVSGQAFGSAKAIRLSFGTSEDNIREAIQRIARALTDLQ